MTTPIKIETDLQPGDRDVSVKVCQDDDGTGLFVTIKLDDPAFELTIKARSGDAAEDLAFTLAIAAEEAKKIADAGWPEDDDAFIGRFDDGVWYVDLEGVRVAENLDCRELAVLALAEAMERTGSFPAAWERNEWGHGGTTIDDEIRAFHDEGGDKMLPFEYEGDQGPGKLTDDDDIEVNVDGGWVQAALVADYGQHGIAWRYFWADHDPHRRARTYLADRGEVREARED